VVVRSIVNVSDVELDGRVAARSRGCRVIVGVVVGVGGAVVGGEGGVGIVLGFGGIGFSGGSVSACRGAGAGSGSFSVTHDD